MHYPAQSVLEAEIGIEEGDVDLVVDDAGIVTGALDLFDGMQSLTNGLLQDG